MKTLSIDQIKERALKILSEHKKEPTVMVTSDGQAFFNANACSNHSRSSVSKGKEPLRVYTFHRHDLEAKKEDKGGLAPLEDRVKAIQEAQTLTAVNELIKEEKAKTVLNAAKDRIDEIMKPQIEAIKAMDNIGQLNELLKDETDELLKAAYQERITELSNQNPE